MSRISGTLHSGTWESRIQKKAVGDPGIALDTLFPKANTAQAGIHPPSADGRSQRRPASAGPVARAVDAAPPMPSRLASHRSAGVLPNPAMLPVNKRLSVTQLIADRHKAQSQNTKTKAISKQLEAKALSPEKDKEDGASDAGSTLSVQMQHVHVRWPLGHRPRIAQTAPVCLTRHDLPTVDRSR